MKKLIGILLLSVFASSAMAQHHGYYGGPQRHYYGGGYNPWVPLIVGATAGYVISQSNRPVIVQQQPVLVQQPQVYQQPAEVVYIDGIAYRKQVMIVNGAYQEVLVRM